MVRNFTLWNTLKCPSLIMQMKLYVRPVLDGLLSILACLDAYNGLGVIRVQLVEPIHRKTRSCSCCEPLLLSIGTNYLYKLQYPQKGSALTTNWRFRRNPRRFLYKTRRTIYALSVHPRFRSVSHRRRQEWSFQKLWNFRWLCKSVVPQQQWILFNSFMQRIGLKA